MTHLTLCQSFLDLLDLDLAEALDLQQAAAGSRVHRVDGVVTTSLELIDVACIDAVSLNSLDVDDVAVLQLGSVRVVRNGAISLTSMTTSSLATEEGMLGDVRRKLLCAREIGV